MIFIIAYLVVCLNFIQITSMHYDDSSVLKLAILWPIVIFMFFIQYVIIYKNKLKDLVNAPRIRL